MIFDINYLSGTYHRHRARCGRRRNAQPFSWLRIRADSEEELRRKLATWMIPCERCQPLAVLEGRAREADGRRQP